MHTTNFLSAMRTYFGAEKSESLLFIIAGLAALGLSAYWLLQVRQSFYNGWSYALIAVALIQLTVGGIVYVRSDKDAARVAQMAASEPGRIASEEIPRMEAVMKNFVMYRRIEIALMVTGIVLLICCPAGSSWRGLGLGLLIQAGLMLGLDAFAEARGRQYLNALGMVVQQV